MMNLVVSNHVQNDSTELSSYGRKLEIRPNKGKKRFQQTSFFSVRGLYIFVA